MEKVNSELRERKMEILFSELTKFSKNYVTIPENNRRGGRGSNNYTPERLLRFLESPEQYSNELVNFSEYLFNVSATYNKIINFYATLPTYAYSVDARNLLDEDADLDLVRKNYVKTLELLEKMNLRHELQKLMKVAYKRDVVYGYEMETNDSYYIMHMPHEHCRISSIEDGVFNYKFNFSIFEGNEDLLESYPPEFEKEFRAFLREKNAKGNKVQNPEWRELDSKRAFAIKINEDVMYPLPPFVSSMESALDEDMYRKIKKNKDALDNFMALVQHIPLDDDSQTEDTFRISLNLAMEFHRQAESVLPEGIGLITSPMKIEAIKLEKSKRDDDLEMIAKDNTLSNAGLPPNIFSPNNKTASGIKYAVQYLEQMSYAPLRQVERWLNRKLKRQSGRFKFKVRMIDVTHYSKDEKFQLYLNASQYGFATRQEVGATLDMSPLDTYNKIRLEQDILGLDEMMVPLASSHTQSKGDSESKGGREKKDDQEISESTEIWRENEE